MPERAVLDASVVLKWYLDDEDHCARHAHCRDAIIAGDVDAVVPSLMLYEIANALNVAVNRGRLSRADAEQILAQRHCFSHLAPVGIRFDAGCPGASPDLWTSAYDAAYLALARLLSIRLYTGDYSPVQRGS